MSQKYSSVSDNTKHEEMFKAQFINSVFLKSGHRRKYDKREHAVLNLIQWLSEDKPPGPTIGHAKIGFSYKSIIVIYLYKSKVDKNYVF